MQAKHIFRILLVGAVALFLFNCEPISVSVNENGEITFARSAGVFFVNSRLDKLTILDWNYGKAGIPVITRWSPDGEFVAYTVKQNKDSNNTDIFLVDRAGKNPRKIVTISNVITQLEWSPDSKYLSYAQPGKDNNLNVADIGLINVANKTSTTILSNTSDVHKWQNAETLVYISILQKNEQNTNMYKGALSTYNANSKESAELDKLIVNKTGYIDCTETSLIFTAHDVGDKEFNESYIDTFPFIYTMADKKIEKIADVKTSYVHYSPDRKNILTIIDDNSIKKLAVINTTNKQKTILVENIKDKLSINSSEVTLYPEWFDTGSILFFHVDNAYGSNGVSLQLMKIDLKSLKKENLQVAIERMVDFEIKKRGGY